MNQGEPVQAIDRRLASNWTVDTARGQGLIHRDDGLTSQATFVDTADGRIFTNFHDPVDPASVGVVVCPPILAEAVRNQRRELVLGWELSAAGMPAARFHYQGSGHSSGSPEEMSFEQMVADAIAVGRSLQERSGVDRVAFVGTRLGALVAASAIKEFPGGPLVLWEPPVDIGRYYNLVFRARIIGLFKRGESRIRGKKETLEDLRKDGSVDIAGYPLAWSLYESTIDLDLGSLLNDAGAPDVLAIQMSVRPDVRPRLADAVKAWAASEATVQTEVVAHDEAWWFGGTGQTSVDATSDALEVIPMSVRFIGAAIP